MSYATIETQVQTLLQNATDIFSDAKQVARGDWRYPMDSGASPLAILYPGQFSGNGLTGDGGNRYEWTLNIDLFVKYSDDAPTYAALIALRDSVTQLLQKYPTLNGLANVSHEGDVSGTEPAPVTDRNGNGPFFLMTTLSYKYSELVFVTLIS